MNSTIKIYTILLLAFLMSLPFALLSQEEDTKETKEKKVTIKTIKEVDGKKIVKDTTFTVTGDDDVKKVVKSFTMDVESDADSNEMIDVIIDVDEDGEWTTDKKKKIIVTSKSGDYDMEFFDEDDNVKVVTIDEDGNKKVIVHAAPHPGHKKVMKFKSGDGEDEEVIILRTNRGHNSSYKWVGKDDEEYEYNFDFDFDIDEFQHDMAEMKAEMREMEIHILDEEGRLCDELFELESLKELEELKALENMKVFVVPPRPPKAPRLRNDFFHHGHYGPRVSDEELRDAGIKNKPDRLELDELDIDNNDGVIELSFSLSTEGSPKVIVYNVYGDKVFNGKPEFMNNSYQLKIDLSKKQRGNYYLMIIDGNTSKTIRISN